MTDFCSYLKRQSVSLFCSPYFLMLCLHHTLCRQSIQNHTCLVTCSSSCIYASYTHSVLPPGHLPKPLWLFLGCSLLDSSKPDGFPDFLHVPDGLWSWHLSISFPDRKSWDHSIFNCLFLKCCSICIKRCYENVWCLSDFHSFINDFVFLDWLSRRIFLIFRVPQFC